jgi:DNA-binding response OmpR family regulator
LCLQLGHNLALGLREAFVVDDVAVDEVLRSAELEMRPAEFRVLAHGQTLHLSRKYQQLLAAMMRNQGRILSREELCALAWGRRLSAGDRAVDVYVSRLRTLLEAALPGSAFIHTHFGLGYRFAADSSAIANRRVTSA